MQHSTVFKWKNSCFQKRKNQKFENSEQNTGLGSDLCEEQNFRIPGAYFSRNTKNTKYLAGILRGNLEIFSFSKIPGYTFHDFCGISRNWKSIFEKFPKQQKNALGNTKQCGFQFKEITLSKTQKSTIWEFGAKTRAGLCTGEERRRDLCGKLREIGAEPGSAQGRERGRKRPSAPRIPDRESLKFLSREWGRGQGGTIYAGPTYTTAPPPGWRKT